MQLRLHRGGLATPHRRGYGAIAQIRHHQFGFVRVQRHIGVRKNAIERLIVLFDEEQPRDIRAGSVPFAPAKKNMGRQPTCRSQEIKSGVQILHIRIGYLLAKLQLLAPNHAEQPAEHILIINHGD